MFLYMCSFFYQISAWVFLIHMLLYAGFYCIIFLPGRSQDKYLPTFIEPEACTCFSITFRGKYQQQVETEIKDGEQHTVTQVAKHNRHADVRLHAVYTDSAQMKSHEKHIH